jgi:SAM-dependent methyltransferase
MASSDIERRVGDYYAERLREHGSTPRGVDWNSEESQAQRFDQLLRVAEGRDEFALNDWGCGYGALAEHLDTLGVRASYAGYDIAEPMVAAARERLGARRDRAVTSDPSALPLADFTVASGIFNVLAGADPAAWTDYVHDTVRAMARRSRAGIAFNMLTSYSDPERMVERLYYADPCAEFDWCKRTLSRHVALLHDYGLFEFTLIVRFDEEGKAG